MINDFEDFCRWMYAIIDDIFHQIERLFKRTRPKPERSDSELFCLAFVFKVGSCYELPWWLLCDCNLSLAGQLIHLMSLKTPLTSPAAQAFCPEVRPGKMLVRC